MTKVTVLEEALQRLPYLVPLPPGARSALAARCRVRAVRRGGVVFEEGRPADALLVIVSGRVKVVRESARGREQVLHVEGPGATLGEVPVFDGGGWVASAVALADTTLVSVPRAAVLDVVRRHPAVAEGVIAVLARRVRGFARLIEDLALRDVTARLARFLLDEAAGGDTLELPGTRDEIGARLGTVREIVSRSLSALAGEGVIDVRGRRVRIRDPRRLAGYANLER